jgi:hypothetical protein
VFYYGEYGIIYEATGRKLAVGKYREFYVKRKGTAHPVPVLEMVMKGAKDDVKDGDNSEERAEEKAEEKAGEKDGETAERKDGEEAEQNDGETTGRKIQASG